MAAQPYRGGLRAADGTPPALWARGGRGVGASLEDAQPDLLETLNPVLAKHRRNLGGGWAP